MECCNEITVALEKTLTEHAALMRKLAIKEASRQTKDKRSTNSR